MVAASSSTATHQLGNTLDFLVVPASFASCVSPVFADNYVAGSDHFPCFFSIDAHTAAVNRPLLNPGVCRLYRSVSHDDLSQALHDRLLPLLSSDVTDFSVYLAEYRDRVVDVLDNLPPFRPKHQNNSYV